MSDAHTLLSRIADRALAGDHSMVAAVVSGHQLWMIESGVERVLVVTAGGERLGQWHEHAGTGWVREGDDPLHIELAAAVNLAQHAVLWHPAKLGDLTVRRAPA